MLLNELPMLLVSDDSSTQPSWAATEVNTTVMVLGVRVAVVVGVLVKVGFWVAVKVAVGVKVWVAVADGVTVNVGLEDAV